MLSDVKEFWIASALRWIASDAISHLRPCRCPRKDGINRSFLKIKPMYNLYKLFKPYLHYKFFPYKSLRCEIVERPGLWMADDRWGELLQDIRTIASKHQGPEALDYGVLSDDKTYTDNTIITLIYDADSNAPVAFNAMSYMDIDIAGKKEDVIHLGLVMVDPDYQSKGMTWILYGLTCMLLFFRNLLNPIWITNVTQVPAVFGSVSESYDEVFPNPRKNTRCTFQHVLIADQVMQHYRHIFGVGDDADFDGRRFIIENSYTGGSDGLKKTFSQAPKHRIELYNATCERELDYDRGDDFLQVGQINLTAARRYFLRDVPPKSLLSLLLYTSFVLVSAVFLPVLRWFASNKQMGEVRPWKAG